MTTTSERRNTITPFSVLLGTISNNLNREDVRRLKIQLQGHINKESLEKLKGGLDLVKILQQRGFVTDKKLAFFRRLLVECELHTLAGLVDEYKQALQSINLIAKEGILLSLLMSLMPFSITFCQPVMILSVNVSQSYKEF